MKRTKSYLIAMGIMMFLLCPSMLLATEYYVSTLGNDSNSGLSSSSAWQTLNKVNSFPFVPGDIVRFERGGVWREQLIPQSGDIGGYITYTSYGSGNKPLLLGSVKRNAITDWTQFKNNQWTSTTAFPAEVGNIVFNNGEAWGIKVWDGYDLDQQNEFFYNTNIQKVRIYSPQNPATIYSSIEVALTRHIIEISWKSYIIIDGLHLAYGSAHGIWGTNTHHVIVRNCDFSFIGGGYQFTRNDGLKVRYGNGIEFWENAHDITIENNRLWQIYDAALTNQGEATNSQYNIYYRNNSIWKSEYCFEYWNRPETSTNSNIYFENNVCFNAGGGWGHSQRPAPRGYGVSLFKNTANTYNLYIRNNIFYNAEWTTIFLKTVNWNGLNNLVLDFNTYHYIRDEVIAWWDNAVYRADNLDAYKAATGKDINSKLLKLQSIQVSPQNVSLTVNQTIQLKVTGIYDDATTIDLTNFASYVSSNAAVASLGSSSIVKGLAGLVKGVARGTAVISIFFGPLGTSSGTLSTTVSVTVS